MSILDIDQEKAWAYLLNDTIDLRRSYLNPTRPDSKPGCRFFWKDNILILMDFSKNSGLNCVNAYCKIHGTGTQESLQFFYSLETNYKPKRKHQIQKLQSQDGRKTIEIFYRDFSKDFLDYFKQFKIGQKQLLRDSTRVYDVIKYTLRDSADNFSRSYYPKDLVIGYSDGKNSPDKFKLYFPERKKPRFKSNLTTNDVWEIVNNPKKWFICKSHKDFLCMENILCKLGYDFSLGMVQNEGSFPKRKDWEEAVQLYVLFDNDAGGRDAAYRFKEYYLNSQLLFLPETEWGSKDPTDYILEMGYDNTVKTIRDLLNFAPF